MSADRLEYIADKYCYMNENGDKILLRQAAELVRACEGWDIDFIEGGTEAIITHKETGGFICVREINERIAEDILWKLAVSLAPSLAAMQEEGS